MPKKRLPAITDMVVWEKVTKGVSWNNMGQRSRAWKNIGGSQEERLPSDKFRGDNTELKERIDGKDER